MFKLFKETKEKGKFIKTVVLPCSQPNNTEYSDCRDQVYTEDEIAILISTEANNCFFDYNHDNKKLNGIYTLQNYQSKGVEYVNGVEIPVGSWIKILFSENDFINDKIMNGVVKGVSNDFSIDSNKNYCKANQKLTPGINTNVYSDVEEKECIIQTYLSFVDYPCNRMPLEIYDYEKYKLNNDYGDQMKLKDKIAKLFNKEDEAKEYVIENNDDLIRVINEISEEKVKEAKETLEQASLFIAEDIDWIKGDLDLLKTDVETAKSTIDGLVTDTPTEENTEEEEAVIENEEEESSNDDTESDESTINNNEELEKISETLEKIQNRLDEIEEKQEKNKNIKNTALVKNVNKGKPIRGFLNRNKE